MKKLFTFLLLPLALLLLKVTALLALDLTTTAASAQGAVGAALPFLQQFATMPMNVLGILTVLNVMWGFLLEHGLEHYIMDHVPASASAWLKPLLPFIGGAIPAIIANMQGGLAFWPAVASALMAGITATKVHDVAPAMSEKAYDKAKAAGDL